MAPAPIPRFWNDFRQGEPVRAVRLQFNDSGEPTQVLDAGVVEQRTFVGVGNKPQALDVIVGRELQAIASGHEMNCGLRIGAGNSACTFSNAAIPGAGS